MRKISKGFMGFILILFLYPLTLKDALGRYHNLNPPLKRLVSLSPAITDELRILGAENLIVGTSNFSSIKGAKRVGGIINPNIEIILSLKPDLILVMQPTPLNSISMMENFGLEVFALDEPKKLEDIVEEVLLLGKITGKEKRAKEIAEDFLSSVKPVKGKRGRIFIGFVKPPFWTACKGSFLDDLAKRAGWENICQQRGWKPMSGEKILEAKPDLLIIPTTEDPGPWLNKFPWKPLLELKRTRVLTFPPDLILRPTVLLKEVYKKLVEIN